MAPAQNLRAVIVGIFIFFGLVILAGGIVVIGGKRKTFAKNITLYAIFPNVGGLQRGNNVWFSGVKVGMVNHIRVEGNGRVRVEMKVEKMVQKFILADARARVANDGLIGNKVVEIYGGTLGSPHINADDTMLVEVTPNMAEMASTLQQSNHNVAVITDNFRRVSDNLAHGEGTLGSLITSDTLARQLSITASRLQVAADNMMALTKNVNAYTAKLQTRGGLANDLVTDTMVFSRLRASAAQIQAASVNAKEATSNLKSISSDIQSNLKSNNNVAGVLLRDTTSAAHMRVAIENVQSGTKKFDESMEALQHNFLLRGFFRKREKQRARQQREHPELQVPGEPVPATPMAAH